MSWDMIADHGLWAVFLVFGLKTVVFVALASVLIRRAPESEVGIWLNWAYIVTALTSLTLTVLFYVLSKYLAPDGLGAWLWLEVPLVVFPTAVAYCNWRVLLAQRRVEQERVTKQGDPANGGSDVSSSRDGASLQ